ncbi:MAG: hypothetical protein NZ455_13960 [Bacteroidia bacterium]|nr:hypothetical protein [Bacteroidia bacterium]MDW8347214.1 hypothetical protein [Bacteroidia bacterium]
MREACGGRASARCEVPRTHFYFCPGGAAPLARSTPTRAQRRDTPKNIKITPFSTIICM